MSSHDDIRPGEMTDTQLDQLLAAANRELLDHIEATADSHRALAAILTRSRIPVTGSGELRVGQKYNVGRIKAGNVAIGDHAKAGDRTDSEPPTMAPQTMVPVPGEAGAAPAVPRRGVFLSYRRQDAAPYARLLQLQLRERFPDVRVFMDMDSIEAGLDFAEVIREAVDSCAVLVALIGRQWATLADERGRRRLDDPDDWVRFEIQAALERGVRVIPVLVDGVEPLRQEQLPAGLQKLARLNVLDLSYGRYEYDAARLLDLIQGVLAADAGSGKQGH
jgi:hypothetical protein